MNTNDLPPAAKLAALIEAGRAANPDINHGRGYFLHDGSACALGFACLGAGASREEVEDGGPNAVRKFLGLSPDSGPNLAWKVMCQNDLDGRPLEDILRELREGELATLPA